jgi:hypothetical protein
MNNDLLEVNKQTLEQLGKLKAYLKSSIIADGTVMKITVMNTAPESTTTPVIVFTNVSVSITMPSDVGVITKRLVVNISRPGIQSNDSFSGLYDEKYFRLLKQNFNLITPMGVGGAIRLHIDNDDAPKTENILLPGQSMVYELNIPPEIQPYVQFKVEGILSQSHLLHDEQFLSISDSVTRAIVLDALRTFNDFQIHNILIKITNMIPAFDEHTGFAEVQKFNQILTTSLVEIESAEKPINEMFHKVKFSWFQAHLHAVCNYLQLIKETAISVQNAIASSNQYQIITEVNKLRGDLVELAYQLNRDNENIMTKFKISDEEVRYKYRSGIENWNKAADQKLRSLYSNTKIWSIIPDRAKRSMVDAERAWTSGSNARIESILNELRIATEQLLLDGLWNQLEQWDGFQNQPEWYRHGFLDLKAEFIETGSQPTLLCLQRACRLQVTNAFLVSKQASEEQRKWFTEQLPDSLYRLRHIRNIAEHEGFNQWTRDELRPYVEEYLGIGKKGVLQKIVEILFTV